MGLLDFLSGGGQSSDQGSGQGLLNYGGVPFGIRLIAAGQALSNIASPGSGGQSGLAMLGRFKEQMAEDKKAAAERADKIMKAKRYADSIRLHNPELAAAIDNNPDMMDDVAKGMITSTFENQQHTRDRQELKTDRQDLWKHEGEVTDKANERADVKDAATRLREDARTTSQQMLTVKEREAQQAFELRKIKDQREADEALRAGNKARANEINTKFFNDTGQVLEPPDTVPGMPTTYPSYSTATGGNTAGVQPMPGGAQVPFNATTPSMQGNAPATAALPSIQGNTIAIQPGQTSQDLNAVDPYTTAWRKQFGDDTITKPEAAMMTAKFQSIIHAGDSDPKKIPSQEEAIAAAAEVYKNVKDQRAKDATAAAATSEAQTKAAEANIKTRMGQADVSEKTISSEESKAENGRVVQSAYQDIMRAKADEKQRSAKGELTLPSTGLGSYPASYISDTNARAVWNANETIKNRVGLDVLKRMRDESENGSSGLGQLAIQELEALRKSAGTLDPTDANYENNLKSVMDRYNHIVETADNYATDIRNLRKNPTPEMMQAFDELWGKDTHLKFVGE
jgi:hypothetical protein